MYAVFGKRSYGHNMNSTWFLDVWLHSIALTCYLSSHSKTGHPGYILPRQIGGTEPSSFLSVKNVNNKLGHDISVTLLQYN